MILAETEKPNNMNTQGSIIWYEATEDNVKMIPMSEDRFDKMQNLSVRLLINITLSGKSEIRFAKYQSVFDFWNIEGVTGHRDNPTHFAFINQPE
jgi:hypothetical protein